jgi:hypothetical protein
MWAKRETAPREAGNTYIGAMRGIRASKQHGGQRTTEAFPREVADER